MAPYSNFDNNEIKDYGPMPIVVNIEDVTKKTTHSVPLYGREIICRLP